MASPGIAGGKVAEVFISYARPDAAVARRLAKALEADGNRVWWDSQLPAHRAYSDVIEQQLHDAKAVIVLWSAQSAGSQWVRAEAELARSENKLVQVQLDGTIPPLPFNQIQCADLAGWRGSRRHQGWAKLASSVAALVGEEQRPRTVAAPKRRFDKRGIIVAALAALLLAAAAVLWPRLFGDSGNDRPVVAVLPFSASSAADQALVSGIWEDTRQALSRNPTLTVLGPHSSQKLAEEGSKRAARAADYLLEGNVRTAGPMIRLSASLVRSKDGVQVWSQTFDRKLDDVFALQSELAREIEGRIRGRLAKGGGVLPEQITTTGEVYALYSEARKNLKRRGPAVQEAYIQLRRVVEEDPNFAPGWADLAKAEKLRVPLSGDSANPLGMSTAEQYARKAIALAPNLASGYAALGLASDFDGPVAENALRKAIQLDPNDAESVTLLANLMAGMQRQDEALDLYSRAIEIEPLWWPPLLYRLSILLERGDRARVNAEMQRVRSLGAPLIEALAGMRVAVADGDLSKAVQLGMAQYRVAPQADRLLMATQVAVPIVQLGYLEEASRFEIFPPFALGSWRNDPRAITIIERLGLPPRQFWGAAIIPIVFTRLCLNNHRPDKVVQLYRAASSTPAEFLRVNGSDDAFALLAPMVAISLKQTGQADDAGKLLAEAERQMKQYGAPLLNDDRVLLARILAVEGKRAEALAYLRKAVDAGWRPRTPSYLPDLANDPPLAELAPDPAFQQARQLILAHFAKERAELGPITVN